MDLGVIALAFLAVFVVELPDKTFIATLVLATRYRPTAVWLGVSAAFLVQTGLAVALGKAVTFLPTELVRIVAAMIFLAGAFLLWREAPRAEAAEAAAEAETDAKIAARNGGGSWWGAVGASFLVLFAAELGDLSQLLTVSLVGHYNAPVAVFIGALAALVTVSGLAVLAGRVLLRHIRLSVVHYAGAVVCLGLATLTLYSLIR